MVAITRFARRLVNFTERSLPVVLDVAGFTAITVGVWLLAGAYAWIVAGLLLILAAYRAQS